MSTVLREMENMEQFVHVPVLGPAVVEMARHAAPGFIVDCTVGGAGHARLLLEAMPQARLLGLDRDPTAVAAARAALAPYGERARVVQARFSQLASVLADESVAEVQVLLADFGVSSPQLDGAGRGFSFREDGPLDMRMDPSHGRPAWQILQTLTADDLANAIYQLGEERLSRRVARAIVAAPPKTTRELAQCVRSVVPKSADGLDPATRTFQAIRMLVNDELGEIDAWLQNVPSVLADGGVAIAISFHSLEDRAVKRAFKQAAKSCVCPPQMPVCMCKTTPSLRILTTKVTQPDAREIADNPRARSARLRAAQRLARTK